MASAPTTAPGNALLHASVTTSKVLAVSAIRSRSVRAPRPVGQIHLVGQAPDQSAASSS
jgi:hypothetical protein